MENAGYMHNGIVKMYEIHGRNWEEFDIIHKK